MTVFIAGHRGMLAQELLFCLRQAGLEAVSQGRPEFDISKASVIRETLLKIQPDIVINAAAYTAVDQAESDPLQAFAINRDGTAQLAETCRELGIPLIHVSTDYVFDGMADRPYREDDPPAPLCVYGDSKWQGELEVRSRQPEHFIVRTAWVYSSYGQNFLKTILRLARERDVLRIVDDQYGCPTWCRDLAWALVNMYQNAMRDRSIAAWGTYHVCSAIPTTWYEFACAIVEEARQFEPLRVQELLPIPTTEYPTPAKRPAYSVLDCENALATFHLPSHAWQERVHDCLQELYTCTPIVPITS